MKHYNGEKNKAPGLNNLPKKRGGAGCLLVAAGCILLWAAGAWLLWHLSMNGPDTAEISDKTIQENGKTEENEDGPFFEIIPGSKESSFVEEDAAESEK